LQHGYIVNGALVYADSSENWAVYQGAQVSELVQSSLFYTDVAYDDGTDRPAMEYVHSVNSSDSWHAEVMDAMGNVGGAVVDDTIGVGYTYDAWGANTSTSWDNTEVLGWKGLQAATRSGLVYMRARWYDPALGRFLSEDPVGLAGGLNQYAFAGDDPINGGDPSGLVADDPDQAQLLCELNGGTYGAFSDRSVCIALPLPPVNVKGKQGTDPEPVDPPPIQSLPIGLLVASRDATKVTPGPKGHPGLCLMSAGELGLAGGEDLTIGPEVLAAEGVGAAASTFFVDGVLHISVEDVPLVEGGAALNHIATVSHSAARTGVHLAGTVTEGNVVAHAHGDSYLTASTALSFIPFANLLPTGKNFVHDCF
jgi:RHS repeat-associated protein